MHLQVFKFLDKISCNYFILDNIFNRNSCLVHSKESVKVSNSKERFFLINYRSYNYFICNDKTHNTIGKEIDE